MDGLVKLMNGNYDQPVNLGNPDEYTIKEFAHKIHHMTHSNSTIKSLPSTTDDPRQRKPDITTAKREIGWAPRVGVEEGLRKAITGLWQRRADRWSEERQEAWNRGIPPATHAAPAHAEMAYLGG